MHHGGHHDEEPSIDLETLETAEIATVGIDVGSSGTQVMFSRLRLRRMGMVLSSKYAVVHREPIYVSEVAFTPYTTGLRINGTGVARIVQNAYRKAGLKPDHIDTGVVILTGEAIRRRNARAIADSLARWAGEFICIAAGNSLEAMLAAHGSGAVKASYEERKRLLNVDIGGGTIKFALIENGRFIGTSALHAGGRLLVTDGRDRITRIEPTAKFVAAKLGLNLRVGSKVTEHELKSISSWMARVIINYIAERGKIPEDAKELLISPMPESIGHIDAVIFSGGVAEYIYGLERRDFHDLGKLLGAEIKTSIDSGLLAIPVLAANECIRATVSGVSQYTVQLSGETVYMSNPNLTPLKNVQVLKVERMRGDSIDIENLASSISSSLQMFEANAKERDVALALEWSGEPSYIRLRALAMAIKEGMRKRITEDKPLIIIVDSDVAQTAGAILREELKVGADIICIDGIKLENFDYIDIGRSLRTIRSVPVTVKSLLFTPEANRDLSREGSVVT